MTNEKATYSAQLIDLGGHLDLIHTELVVFY
jgi:hypothetical protein